MSIAASLREFATRYRMPILGLATILFVAGLVWSIQSLSLDVTDLAPLPLLALLVLLVPLDLLLSAVSLVLLGQVARAHLHLGEALAVTAYGRIANILPIPGTAMARGMALKNAGASTKDTLAVLATSWAMTLALALLAAGAALVSVNPAIGMALLAGGLAIFGWTVHWMAGHSDLATGLGLGLSSLAVMFVAGLRFLACFLAIGMSVSVVQSLLFTVSSTLGSYAGIVPAGLGISEAISAALAVTIGVSSAGAFLATGLNRICGLAVSGIVAAVTSGRRPVTEGSTP